MPHPRRWPPLLAAALLAACGSSAGPAPELPATVGGALRLTGASPFVPGCDGTAAPSGTLYRGAEVEPWLAADPADAQHLVAVWQQDRWSNGGAAGLLTAVSRDGGLTWASAAAPFTRCTGGSAGQGTDFQRASDPWVAIAPDGTAHQVALAFDPPGSGPARRQAILASRSADGGLTWSAPAVLQAEASSVVAVDKESISADPEDARRVYVAWDRLTGLDLASGLQTGPAWFARSLDGGLTWEAARAIYQPGLDAQTIGHQIAVLPGGDLVDVFMELRDQSTASASQRVALVRSSDAGASWTEVGAVAPARPVRVVDPKEPAVEVRAGQDLPVVAVDRASGRLWVAWADSSFSGGQRSGIALSRSDDGGRTWTAPIQANQEAEVQAFTPALAVGPGGRLAVAYLDLRQDSPANPGRLLATNWLATTTDGGATWQEAALGAAYDLRLAPDAGGLFVGDYQALVARAGSFTAIFAMTNAGVADDRTDLFVGGPAPVTREDVTR